MSKPQDIVTKLLNNNRAWAEEVRIADPDFFERLKAQQSPEFLWIGCSDSRVPANQITGLMPGEVFVHRNVANLVPGEDMNSHSVIQYAVEALKVQHIIVCGHYGCGGVKAALHGDRLGLVDYWLTGVRELLVRCSGCGHESPAVGPRLHGSTVVECELCSRLFVVTDDEVNSRFPGARYLTGKWRIGKVS